MTSFLPFARPIPFLVLLLLAGTGLMNGQNFAGKVVESITYDPRKQPIDPRDLQRMLLVQTGRPLQLHQIAGTIDRLFSSGLYTDIKVDAEPSGAGVRLRFITESRRFIGHVTAEGQISSPPSRSVLMSDAQLALGTPFDAEALETARKNLEQIMRDNGLYRSHVGVATIEDPDTHQMTIRFEVVAGKRAHYETPLIKGDTKDLSDEAIVRATGWRVPLIHYWRQVTESLTDKGVSSIQKKYAKKDRLTATVTVPSSDYDFRKNRLKPTLDIDAGPKITINALEAKVSKRKLRKLVPVYQEGSVDNDLLTEGAVNIRDYFQSKGYPDVDVTFKREPTQDDRELINYYIATGPRRKLVNIAITGSDYFTRETIRERMFLQTKSLVLRYGRYSETFRQKDEEAIQNLYASNGFRDAKVTSTVETNYNGKPSDIGVTFRINQGKQWRVASLKVVGASRLDLSGVERRLSSVVGQPYTDPFVASDRNLILEYYYDNGFPSASFTATTTSGDEPATVNLTYHITEGPREFVRNVIISGLNRTHPSLVKQRIRLADGEPLSLTKINDEARRLTNLGIFASVNTALQDPDGTNRYKTVLFDFDEAARYTFNVGFGADLGSIGGTTSDLRKSSGQQGVYPRVAFNLTRINFLGVGQTLSLQTRYSSLEQREGLNYIVPRFLGSQSRTVTFSALYDTTRDVTTFSSRRLEGAVQTSQRFTRASTLLTRFAYRRVSTGDVVIPSLLIPQLLQPVRIGILTLSYIQDHRDNPADAHHGYWNTVDAGVAGNFFGSQRNFARILARNATYTAIGRNLVFARQTQLGAIVPFNLAPNLTSVNAVPLPERFFGGGGTSMRGFGYNEAGPRDIGGTSPATGFPIGGNGLFFNTFELRFPLLGPNISGVVFEDMGNIFDTFGNISLRYHQRNNQDFNYTVQAPGFGIRYKTPLGPVRVDFAYALNPTHYNGYSGTIQDLLDCAAQQTKTQACTSSPRQLGHFQFIFSIGQAF
jgi:outer membrane protein insertion porin family